MTVRLRLRGEVVLVQWQRLSAAAKGVRGCSGGWRLGREWMAEGQRLAKRGRCWMAAVSREVCSSQLCTGTCW